MPAWFVHDRDWWCVHVQGLNCSRCLYTEHCSGCVVMRDSTDLCLTPSDLLAVHFTSLLPHQQDLASALTEHPSLCEPRHPKTLTLGECLRLFAERYMSVGLVLYKPLDIIVLSTLLICVHYNRSQCIV
jgi:hypothetical protein